MPKLTLHQKLWIESILKHQDFLDTLYVAEQQSLEMVIKYNRYIFTAGRLNEIAKKYSEYRKNHGN